MDVPKRLGIKESDFRLVIGSSKVEFDPAKNDSNKTKHGYSFDVAIEILNKIVFPFVSSPPPFIVKDSIEKEEELRSNMLTVDKQGNVILIALTMRPNESVRIISLRAASPKERKIFCELTGYNQCIQGDAGLTEEKWTREPN